VQAERLEVAWVHTATAMDRISCRYAHLRVEVVVIMNQ
jgi:hypothetical protein